ncbi:sigma-70 family RNA polymerase sigma factor [Staphylococcus carnosus]|uniref:sigma-70 family RNA polymerase sigma factor n=1 Tax=Staphylococcus carnosus TaxID=1281 RepID=UPI0009F6E2C7
MKVINESFKMIITRNSQIFTFLYEVTSVNIEYQINHHKRIIFSLLRKYNIRYDTDEYAQLLTIKMWNLIRQFDTSIHDSMSRYLFQRLHFYLVDIFRKKSRQLNTCTLETTLNETKRCPMISQTSFPLIVNDYYHLLNEQERIWLNLKLYGYKQFEIQQLMNKSATTIRKYQNCVRSKLEPLRTFIKGGFLHA